MYTLTETGTTWTAVQITTYDFTAWSSTKAIATGGGPWHFMDFHDTWMLFKPGCTVFKTAHSSKVFSQTAVTINTGCNFFDGRPMMGGFNASNYYTSAAWRTYLASWQGTSPHNIESYIDALSTGLGPNWVKWGTIGGGDLLWLFNLEMAKYGFIPSERPTLTNGSFTGAATGWTFASPWAYGSNKMTGTLVSTDLLQAPASQVSGDTLEDDVTYRVVFTISNYSAGSIAARLGNLGTAGTSRAADGTFTEDLTCQYSSSSNNFYLIPTGFSGDIDTVACYRLPEAYTDGDPLWLDLVARNELGAAPMPWQGDVASILPLGNNVVVYGTTNASTYKQGGITALEPVSLPLGATFGFRPIPGLGSGVAVAGRCAAGGSEDVHAFVDEGGDVWSLTPSGADRLGYSEFFGPMTGANIVVSFDPQQREFYIGDGLECFVLSKFGGLSKAPWIPTSVHFAQGGLVAPYLADDTDIELVTMPIDATAIQEQRGTVFEVVSVEVTTTDIDTTGWSAYIDYRLKNSQAWTRSAAVLLDERGVARIPVVGIECRVVLTHPDRTKVSGIDGLYITLATEGKLSTRHWLNASTPSAATV